MNTRRSYKRPDTIYDKAPPMTVWTSIAKIVSFIWTHPANRRRRLVTLGTAISWQIFKRFTGRHWDLPVFDGLELRCYPDSSSASLVLYCSGRPDYHEMGFMAHYLRPGDAFVDIGANIGVYTLLAASLVGASGHIESFEPAPKAFDRLNENLALNDLAHVRAHRVAVGVSRGTVRFTTEHDTLNRIAWKLPLSGVSLEVPVTTLDEALGEQHFAMGKMDIEGAEPLALKGAEKRLAAADPPVWLLELNGLLHDYGFTEEALAKWLGDRGYDLALYDADTRQLRFGTRPWQEHGNVLAISRVARNEVLRKIAVQSGNPNPRV